MQARAFLLPIFAPVLFVSVQCADASPIGQVLDLISKLQAEVVSDGEKAQKIFKEYTQWCEERKKSLAIEIQSGKAVVAALQASVKQEAALMGSLASKTEDLAADTAKDEADMRAAAAIREKETADFALEEKQLSQVIDTLERAISILEKHAVSMAQLKNAATVPQALGVMVQASMFGAADARRLIALVQGAQESEDEPAGAPSASANEAHGGAIIDTLSDLLEKAKSRLGEARKKEASNLHHFQMLKRSLEDEIAYSHKEASEAERSAAESRARKVAAEGDLKVTLAEFWERTTSLGHLRQQCQAAAQDFDARSRTRSDELKALAEAKRVVAETTGAADSLAYGSNKESFLQESLLQESSLELRYLERASEGSGLSSHADLARFEAVRFVRDMARRQDSADLSLLATRMAAAMRPTGGLGDDPFAKVRALIQEMLKRLEAEIRVDSERKAYCDKELGAADQKIADRAGEVGELSIKMDRMSVRSAQLKEEAAALQKSLDALAASQVELDRIRGEEHMAFLANKADLEQGLQGVKAALKILNAFYAEKDARTPNATKLSETKESVRSLKLQSDSRLKDEDVKSGTVARPAHEGIVGLLEVCESDFSKGLAELINSEEKAESEYEQASKDNAVQKATDEQGMRYKAAERADLDKAREKVVVDHAEIETELSGVQKHLAVVRSKCDQKTDAYEEQARRRAAEVSGLREALEILEGEATLLQRTAKRRRGGIRKPPLLRAAGPPAHAA